MSSASNKLSVSFSSQEVPTVTWDDCVSLDSVVQELRERVFHPRQNPDALKKFGMSPPSGLLLYGPQGSGKSLLAKAAASELSAKFLHVCASDLTGGRGQCSNPECGIEDMVRSVFDQARQEAPCVLYISEADHVLSWSNTLAADDEAGQRAADRLGNQLMTELDGICCKQDVLVVGATSRPDIIDRIFLRPGRLDQLIHVPLPNEKSRADIIKHIFKLQWSSSAAQMMDEDIDYFASITSGYDRGRLKDVCMSAAKLADTPVAKGCVVIQRNHVQQAIKLPQLCLEVPTESDRCEHFANEICAARGFNLLSFRFPSDTQTNTEGDAERLYCDNDDDDDLYS